MKIKIAEIVIEFDPKYAYIGSLVKKYLTADEADFSVFATDEEISAAAERYSEPKEISESIVIYSKIAERLPDYNAILIHGAALADGNDSYLFTAPSGIGKTTHIKNWLSVYGTAVHVLNGDKPIIRFFNGEPFVCGTPWQGKEGLGLNEIKKLKSIVIFHRGKENHASISDSAELFDKLISQIYIPKGREEIKKTLMLANKLTESVTLIRAECNMKPESAIVVKNAIMKAV